MLWMNEEMYQYNNLLALTVRPRSAFSFFPIVLKLCLFPHTPWERRRGGSFELLGNTLCETHFKRVGHAVGFNEWIPLPSNIFLCKSIIINHKHCNISHHAFITYTGPQDCCSYCFAEKIPIPFFLFIKRN